MTHLSMRKCVFYKTLAEKILKKLNNIKPIYKGRGGGAKDTHSEPQKYERKRGKKTATQWNEKNRVGARKWNAGRGSITLAVTVIRCSSNRATTYQDRMIRCRLVEVTQMFLLFPVAPPRAACSPGTAVDD